MRVNYTIANARWRKNVPLGTPGVGTEGVNTDLLHAVMQCISKQCMRIAGLLTKGAAGTSALTAWLLRTKFPLQLG